MHHISLNKIQLIVHQVKKDIWLHGSLVFMNTIFHIVFLPLLQQQLLEKLRFLIWYLCLLDDLFYSQEKTIL